MKQTKISLSALTDFTLDLQLLLLDNFNILILKSTKTSIRQIRRMRWLFLS